MEDRVAVVSLNIASSWELLSERVSYCIMDSCYWCTYAKVWSPWVWRQMSIIASFSCVHVISRPVK